MCRLRISFISSLRPLSRSRSLNTILPSILAVPLLLEESSPALDEILKALGWINGAAGRLTRMLLALSAAALLLGAGILAPQLLLVDFVMPDLLSLNIAQIALTLRGWPWFLCLTYILFLVLDGYWTVASVFVFYDLQARRLGTDLRLRIQVLREGRP